MEESRYYFEVNKHPDKGKIIPFLKQNYYRHEPLQLMYLGKHVEKISPADRRGIASYLDKSHEILLASSTCFTVHRRITDEIVAVMLIHVEENPLYKKEDPDKDYYALLYEKMFPLYETMNHLPSNSPLVNDVFRTVKFPALKEAKIFERYPDAWTAANIMVLCVAEEYRGQGLASLLVKKAVDWVKTSEINVVYGLFTSEFAQRAAEKDKFERIKDMDLMSFKNELEKPIFEGMEPRIISIMALQVRKNASI